MDEFEISRLGALLAVTLISLAIWAMLIGVMVLL